MIRALAKQVRVTYADMMAMDAIEAEAWIEHMPRLDGMVSAASVAKALGG